MPSQNRVRIYAGPNGSGKSSLYKVISKEYISGLFVNADEIEKQLKQQELNRIQEKEDIKRQIESLQKRLNN